MVLAIAWVMTRPAWRIPALLFALLAVPGNVDNLMPQMRLDPHDIANATAPAISFVDVLLAWALILTAREGRLTGWPTVARAFLLGSVVVAALAAVMSLINLGEGIEAAAVVRGILAFARMPAALALAFALRSELRHGRALAGAAALGVLVLIANGLYTSASVDATRFTAATFGRNGFSLVLVVGALLSTGLAIELRRGAYAAPRWAWKLAFLIAASALFGAIATGTRMSLLVAVPAAIGALIANRSWWNRGGVLGVAAIVLGVVVVAGAATLWTSEGARALSGWLNPGETVDIITDPESEPDYSPVRTRTRWWSQAMTFAREDPLTGIGPYQWNVRRYELEPTAEPIVADPHNTYIQTASEYGFPVLAAYTALLLTVVLGVALAALRARSPGRHSAASAAVVAAALMIPVTEATNSYFFNVRIGALAWLLLGTSLVLTVIPSLLGDRAEADEGRAVPRGTPERAPPM